MIRNGSINDINKNILSIINLNRLYNLTNYSKGCIDFSINNKCIIENNR